jgi:hypothetical protein
MVIVAIWTAGRNEDGELAAFVLQDVVILYLAMRCRSVEQTALLLHPSVLMTG